MAPLTFRGPPALRAPRRDPRRPRASRPPCWSLPRCWGPAASPGSDAAHIAFCDGRSLGSHQSVPHAGGIRLPATVGTRPESRVGEAENAVGGWYPKQPPAVRHDSTIPIAFAVAAIAATTIVIGGGGRSASSGGVLAQSIGGSRTANSLEKLKPGLLASNPFGVSTSTTRSAANASARAVAHRSRINSFESSPSCGPSQRRRTRRCAPITPPPRPTTPRHRLR